MLSVEVVGSIEMLLVVVAVIGELTPASAESVENEAWCSAADFVGEAKRLSGRMCSKLLQHQTKINNIRKNPKTLICANLEPIPAKFDILTGETKRKESLPTTILN